MNKMRMIGWSGFVTAMLLAIVPLTQADTPAPGSNAPTPGNGNTEAPAPAVKPKMDAASTKILQAMSDYYAKAQTISVQAKIDASINIVGQPPRKSVGTVQYRIQRPDKYSIRFTGDNEDGQAISDGKTITTYVQQTGQYTQVPVDPATVFQHPMMGLLINGALVAAKPLDAITRDLTSATYIGVEKVGDADCHHLKMSDAEGDVDVWIGNGDQPLVHQAVVDQRRGLVAAGHAGSVIINIAYTDWRIGRPIDAGVFKFEPPADAKKVQQFGEGAQSDLEGKPAPDFTLNTLDGKTVKLSDLKDKVVILDFWATWCGPCRMAMPIIDKVAGKFAEQGVRLYAVNLRETPDQIKSFLKEQNLSVNVLLDSDGKVGNDYRANAIPQTVIIDRNGVVSTVHVGLLPNMEQTLTDELKTLTAKAEPK
ncbi:MAG: DUF2092 domain-containing protein [Phycisphaerales bacterium]